jgi:hypothetical protein
VLVDIAADAVPVVMPLAELGEDPDELPDAVDTAAPTVVELPTTNTPPTTLLGTLPPFALAALLA